MKQATAASSASASASASATPAAAEAAPPAAIPALPATPPTAAAVTAAKLRNNGSMKRAPKVATATAAAAAEPAPVAPGTVHALVGFSQATAPEPEATQGTPITITTTTTTAATVDALAATTTTPVEEEAAEEAKASPLLATTADDTAPVVLKKKKKKVAKKKTTDTSTGTLAIPVVASVDGDEMTVSLSPTPPAAAAATSSTTTTTTISDLHLPDAVTPTEISNPTCPPLPAGSASSSSSSSSSSPLSPFQLALQTLEAGCAFTSLSLSDPNVVTSTLQKEKIFMWLSMHPHATLATAGAAAATSDDDEHAGALLWCPLASSRALQTKVESSTRRLDVSHLVDLFLGRQFGLFVARAELEHLDDQACLSLVSIGEEETQRKHLDLIAEDLHEFQQWMDAFNCMLQGEESDMPAAAAAAAAAPTDTNEQPHKEWDDDDELTKQKAGGRETSMAPTPAILAASAGDLESTAEDGRISVPLDDAIQSRTPQVQLRCASMQHEAELHRTLLVAHHWRDLSRLGASGLAQNIELGQWCVHRMREGVRVQRVDARPGDGGSSPVRPGEPLRAERSFLVYRDALPADEDGAAGPTRGCILSSRCEMDESFLLSDPAQSSPIPGSHTVATQDIVEVVLGQFGGAWEAAAASSHAAVAVAAIPHARCVSFIQASSVSLDVEFDSLTHLLIWVLGLKFLILHSADPVAFPLTIATLPSASSSSTAAVPAHSSSSSSSSSSSLKSLPDPLRSLVAAFVESVDAACVAAQWCAPITASDGAFEELYRGAAFQAFFAATPSVDSTPPLSSHAVHLFYRFDDPALDGRYGSFYWNPISAAAASSPSSSNTAAAQQPTTGQFERSVYRRLEIGALTAIMLGQMSGDSVLGAEGLFHTHREEVREVLRDLTTQTDHCITIVGADDTLHLVWLRSMCASPASASASLHKWVESLRALLARAGRGLVLEASAAAGARWLSVTGGPSAEAEVESVATLASPFSAAASPPQLNVLLAAASGPASFVPPPQTPDYFDARALLERGRRFYSYSFLPHSNSTEPVVVRQAVVVYFSTALPPARLCDTHLFLLPQGEEGFPALWCVDDPNESDEDETLSAPQLQAVDMVFSRCLSLHEVTDLYCGTQSALWHSDSARLQFAPSASASFDEERCMTALAAAAPGVRQQREIIVWNLEARTAKGFGDWIDALSLMLPVHADGGEEQAVAETAAPAKEVEAAAAAQPTVLLTLATDADPSSPYSASMKRRFSWIEPLSPSSSLRRGCNFLLLRPPAVGEIDPLHTNRVQLFLLDADQMRSMGVRMDDESVFPSSCLPLDGEDGYQGCLYWRPLSDAVFKGSEVRFDELRADQCMPLHVISDLYHGKETPLFRLSQAAEQLADTECFSLASRNGDEWNLHSLAGPPEASVIVENVVSGIASLLERAGKGFADGDAAPEDEQPQGVLPPGSGTMMTSPVRTAVSSALPTCSDADLRSHGVSASAGSPSAAHLLSDDSTVEVVLGTLGLPAHVSDQALQLLGVILLYNHVAALEAEPAVTPANMLRLIHDGVARRIVQSMMLFPQLEQLQELGCGALWMLSVSEEAEGLLVEDGAIRAVVRALENHKASATVVAQAAGALRNLCVAAGHAELVGDAGGLEALLGAMRSHAASPALLHQCLGALASLALAATNKSRLANLGGIEMVLGIMRRFPFEQLVHLEGCASLRNLVAHDAANKSALTALGGLELLVKSFITFRRDRSVQLHACGALWNCTANHAGNKTALAALPGGIEALLSTLATHGADEEVARECCGTLRNISSIEGARARLAQTGAIAACIDVQRRFPSSSILQFQCCALLFNMASPSTTGGSSGAGAAATYADDIARVGGAATLAVALRTFMRRDPAVVEECCGALWMLAKANREYTQRTRQTRLMCFLFAGRPLAIADVHSPCCRVCLLCVCSLFPCPHLRFCTGGSELRGSVFALHSPRCREICLRHARRMERTGEARHQRSAASSGAPGGCSGGRGQFCAAASITFLLRGSPVTHTFSLSNSLYHRKVTIAVAARMSTY